MGTEHEHDALPDDLSDELADLEEVDDALAVEPPEGWGQDISDEEIAERLEGVEVEDD